jgi:hypothetical protein
MLTIRREQMLAFEEAQLAQFRIDVLAHLERYDPEATKLQGRERVARMIADAVARAARLPLVSREDALRYVIFVYLFGPEFESDPKYPWSQESFEDVELTLRQKLDIFCVYGEHILGSRFHRVMARNE